MNRKIPKKTEKNRTLPQISNLGLVFFGFFRFFSVFFGLQPPHYTAGLCGQRLLSTFPCLLFRSRSRFDLIHIPWPDLVASCTVRLRFPDKKASPPLLDQNSSIQNIKNRLCASPGIARLARCRRCLGAWPAARSAALWAFCRRAFC